jgi:hypothetical protein
MCGLTPLNRNVSEGVSKGLIMHRASYISLVSLFVCINVFGCSKGPGSKEASTLAFNYLSGMIPGITQKEINILGTLELEGDTIVIVKAGGMYCDMPVIKSNGRWATGAMSCYGQFEPPEKAVVRLQDTFRARFKNKVDGINRTLLYTTDKNNVRYNKHEFNTDSAVYHVTLLGSRYIDCTNEHISSKLKPLINSLCSDYETHNNHIYYNISYEYDYFDRNGNLHSQHIVNEDICSNKQFCH